MRLGKTVVKTTSKMEKDVTDLKVLQCIICFDLLGIAADV